MCVCWSGLSLYGFVCAYFSHLFLCVYVCVSGPGPFPAVLDMWGGGGGLVEYRAALLASHGFVALALEYLTPNKKRTLDIETGYFEVCVLLSKA